MKIPAKKKKSKQKQKSNETGKWKEEKRAKKSNIKYINLYGSYKGNGVKAV